MALPVLLMVLHGPIATNILNIYTFSVATQALDITISRRKLNLFVGVFSLVAVVFFIFQEDFAAVLDAWLIGLVAWVAAWGGVRLVDYFWLDKRLPGTRRGSSTPLARKRLPAGQLGPAMVSFWEASSRTWPFMYGTVPAMQGPSPWPWAAGIFPGSEAARPAPAAMFSWPGVPSQAPGLRPAGRNRRPGPCRPEVAPSPPHRPGSDETTTHKKRPTAAGDCRRRALLCVPRPDRQAPSRGEHALDVVLVRMGARGALAGGGKRGGDGGEGGGVSKRGTGCGARGYGTGEGVAGAGGVDRVDLDRGDLFSCCWHRPANRAPWSRSPRA